MKITREDVEFFESNGYLVLRGITSRDEIAEMAEIYDGLFARRAGRDAGDQFDLAGADEDPEFASLPQILRPSNYAPALADTRFRRNALNIARQLLGPEANLKGDHAIFKPPLTAPETPWHQDEAYWNPAMTYNDVSFWLPLQEATPENGCMYFVPGSHRLKILDHRPIGDDPRIHGLELVDADSDLLAQAVACPLDPGDATVHGSRTLHYTPPNRSGQPRRAYILGCGTPERPRRRARRFPWQERQKTLRSERAADAQRARESKDTL